MPPRSGIRTAGTKGGRIVWDTRDFNGGKFLRLNDATLNKVRRRLVTVKKRMENFAKTKHKWENHPERHPTRAWPSPRTAEQGLFAFGPTGKVVFGIGITHNPLTVWVRKRDGAVFNYGVRLETWHGGQYAIIPPTMERYAPQVMRTCEQAMTLAGVGRVPDQSLQDVV